ncbi:MAG: helix-hairpin-helix domain-containing protein [Gemmatimonadota bacterium]|nr:helix-hairpin-helix domain-containing protein [Gemmatimonadota bacterium]
MTAHRGFIEMLHLRRSALPLLLLSSIASSAHAQVGENLGLLNPNLASSAELGGVPGLPSAAVAEIEERRPFLRMDDLHALVTRHVSSDALEGVYRAMWVPIDLNDVKEEEILLIPGVGARMLHEFEEYRPYAGLAEFHREIGKYVDDAELARLAQYVYVRIDLNTASEEAILSIPGVGARMLHEFEEYRPYESMAQFRREIGKYVDDAELSRLERYVEIR